MKLKIAILLIICLTATIASAITGGGRMSGIFASYRAPQAPNAPTGVTATAGNTQNTVNWTDGTGPGDPATSYTLYGDTFAFPTTPRYTGSATSYTHTGLTNGTPYYYRLTASNAAGTSGYSSPDATATPSATITYDLTTGSLNTTVFGTAVAGTTATPTITGGALTIANGVAASSAGIVYYKSPITRGGTATYRIKLSMSNFVAGDGPCIGLLESSSPPVTFAYGDGTGYNANRRIEFNVSHQPSGVLATGFAYYNGSLTRQWATTTPAWTTAGTGVQQSINLTQGTSYWFEFISTPTTFKMRILAADGTTVLQESANANWSDVKNNSQNLYLYWGDPFTDYYGGEMWKAYSLVVQ